MRRTWLRLTLPGLVTATLGLRADPPGVTVDALPRSLARAAEFAPGDPAGGAAEAALLPFRPIAVPGPWQAGGFPGHGVGWYRIRFTLGPGLSGVPLAFSCAQIRDSDEAYLDGVLVGSTGRFPPRYDKGTAIARVYGLPPALVSGPGSHELLLRVFNAGPRGGGLAEEPFIDSLASAYGTVVRREAPGALLAAALAALGLLSLLLFLEDRRELDSLYFSLLTGAGALHGATGLSIWRASGLPLSLLFRIQVASLFALVGLFSLLLHRFFRRPPSALGRLLVGVNVTGLVACLGWPRVDDLYRLLLLAMAAFAVCGADALLFLGPTVRKGSPHGRPFFAGTVVLVLAGAHDALRDLGLVAGLGRSLLGPALFVFALLVLAALADRVARLRVAATTDPLTGLSNRAVLFERFALELARAGRTGRPLTVALLDLDGFKEFNDEFGHVAGDRLLRAAAESLTASVRTTDLAARYGGEEFVLLLPGADADEALVCLERVRTSVAACRAKGATRGTTISIGFTVFDPSVSAGASANALLRHADGALYQAKARGRNRVVAAEGSAPASTTSSAVFVGQPSPGRAREAGPA